jgi:hypothetical protein
MSIDDRHRDKNGEISRKHGNTLVSTLRRIYGPSFAAGESESAKLSDVLAKLHETSLTQLVEDHESGGLEEKVRKAALPRPLSSRVRGIPAEKTCGDGRRRSERLDRVRVNEAVRHADLTRSRFAAKPVAVPLRRLTSAHVERLSALLAPARRS